ncbi:MAG: hypothetical protein PHC51_11685 [bacterium]|nr:hypothetical protein [bacterium]
MMFSMQQRQFVAFMRHDQSVVNRFDEWLKKGLIKKYPDEIYRCHSMDWPLCRDASAPANVQMRLLTMLPQGLDVHHWGTGPFVRHIQTCLSALSGVYIDESVGIHEALRERQFFTNPIVGVHNELQERPFGELDQVEPEAREQADPAFYAMNAVNPWMSTPARGISHDQMAHTLTKPFLHDVAIRLGNGVYFTSRGQLLALRYLMESLSISDMAREDNKSSDDPWQRIPNCAIIVYSNFDFAAPEETPFSAFAYRMMLYPEGDNVTVIAQELIPRFEASKMRRVTSEVVVKPEVWMPTFSLIDLQNSVLGRETGLHRAYSKLSVELDDRHGSFA